MSGNAVRLQAIKDVEAYVPPAVSFIDTDAPGEIFGENVFSTLVMQKRLPKSVHKSVMADHRPRRAVGGGSVTAPPSPSSPERPWFRACLTRPAFPTAVCATPSRPAVTPAGT